MNIAVTAAKESINSLVFGEFAQTPYLLIVDMETMRCTALPHQPKEDSDQALVRVIIEHNCEAVITGKIGEEAFKILADEAVTRYCGTGMTAAYALEAMENRELKLIRNPEGTDECASSHHELEELQVCSGHQH
jgi:predicted Fe-Mo cluster-binding NifX family protein